MQPILIDKIVVENRQRKDLGNIEELADSIETLGLIHPLVLMHTVGDTYRLIAGGRRLEALKLLGATELHHGVTSRPGTYGYIWETEMPDDVQYEIELAENVHRKAMTWQEEVLCIDEVHRRKQTRNALEGKKWGYRETGRLFNISVGKIAYVHALAERIRKEPEGRVSLAATQTDALRVLLQEAEDAAAKELATRSLTSRAALQAAGVNPDSRPVITSQSPDGNDVPPPVIDGDAPAPVADDTTPPVIIPLSSMLHNRDCLSYMSECAPGTFDHIITDLPYGIDMAMLDHQNQHGGMSNIDRIEDTHDVKQNEDLFRAIIPLAFKVIKDNGFFITWCDVMQWQRLYDLGIAAGFKVQRWPITWVKMHQCMNQQAQYNFTKNTEIAIVMRKPGATLAKTSPNCVVMAANTQAAKQFSHPFVKPFEVWEYLLRVVALPGQHILEPCAGVGSGVLSFLQTGYNVTACEIDEKHYNNLVVNVRDFYTKHYPNAQFV